MAESRTAIDSLIDQVALTNRSVSQLAEIVTHLAGEIGKVNVAVERQSQIIDTRLGQLTQAIERQNKAIDGHLEIAKQQERTAQQNATNIAQLIQLAQQQQATVDRLLAKN